MIQDFGSGPWSTLEFLHKLEFPHDMAQSTQDETMYPHHSICCVLKMEDSKGRSDVNSLYWPLGASACECGPL